MATFDDDEQLDDQVVDAEVPSTAIEKPNTSNAAWLQRQLESYSTALTQAEKDKAKIFKEATNRLLERQKQLEEPDWFGIAAALGKPTRTGAIGEQISNVNEVLSAQRKERRAGSMQLQDLMDKYKLAEADRKPAELEKQLSLGIQIQKSLPKEKLFEIQSLMDQMKGLPENDPKRVALQSRIDYLGGKRQVKPAETKPETPDQYALKILKDEDAKPGTHPPDVVTRARRILKVEPTEKAETNLSLEQWANKVLSEEGKKPGTHSKADVARANSIIRKATYIAPDKSGAEDKPKPQSPAGKLAADEGFTPGTPAYSTRVKEIQQSGKRLSSTQEKELFEQEDVINGGKSALLNLDKALKLSPLAYEGGLAETRQAAGRFIPGIKSSEAQVASTQFRSIMGEQMLAQLKAIFGGNPTEGERKVLADLQGSLGMSHAERAPIINDAMAAVRRRVKAAEDRIKGIKSGAYGPDVPEMAKGGPVRMQRGGMTDTSGGMSLANMGRAVGQGLGMSFGDEAIARVRAKLEGRPYEEVLAEERAAYESFAKKHPVTALTTEIVSGALPTIGLAMLPGGQTAAGANIVRTAPTLKRLATSGAITGGISGFGAGEGGMGEKGSVVDRLPSAGMGAGFGAVAGPVASKTGNLAGRGYQAVKDKLTPSVNSVDQAAMRKVLQAMGRDEMDVNAARQRMSRDQQLGVKSTMADVSPSVTSLAEAAVTVPGKGKKLLGQKLEDRLAEGRESVAQRSQKDIARGQDYTAKEDSLVSTLRKNARSVYEQAYGHGEVYDPRILKVLEDDTFAKAYDKARSIISKEARAAELRGEDVSKYQLRPIYNMDADGNWVRTGEVPDVQTLDYLKRGIDALIDQGYGSEKSISKAEAGALKDLKNAFVGVIDDIVPDYRAARAQYRGDAEVLDALRFGREEYLSPKFTPAQVVKQMQNMSQAERDSLRVGVSQSILGKILETPNQINAAQRVIGAPSTRKRLAALFDDPNEYKIFEEALMREAQLFRNAQDILRGSRTQMKKEAIDDLKRAPGILDIAGEAVDFANAGPGTMVGRVLKFLQSRATLDEKTAGEVANMLRAGSPQEVNAVLDKLEQSAGKFAKEASRTATTERAITRGVGSAAGEPPRTPEPPRPEETDEERLERLMRD
jgi:hypothetical protein